MNKYFVSYTVYNTDGRSFNSNAGIECDGNINNHEDIQKLETALACRYREGAEITILYFRKWDEE